MVCLVVLRSGFVVMQKSCLATTVSFRAPAQSDVRLAVIDWIDHKEWLSHAQGTVAHPGQEEH